MFKSNTVLLNLFVKRYKSNVTNFYEPIIDLYLDQSEENSEENKKFLEEMLIYMVNISSIPKFLMEYIYQKLAIYLRYNTEKEVDYVIENMPKIMDKLTKISPFQSELEELRIRKGF